jgi:hypothetical protein
MSPHRPNREQGESPQRRRRIGAETSVESSRSRRASVAENRPLHSRFTLGGTILSTLDHGVLLLSAGIRIDGLRRMMAIAAVVGGRLTVPNNPVPRTQWGFGLRNRGRRRRRRRGGGRGRIVCAANQDENRHTDQDQSYAGSNSIGGVSRFPEPNGHGAGKIATLYEMAGANFRERIPLHFSLPFPAIALIIRKISEFARRLLIFKR